MADEIIKVIEYLTSSHLLIGIAIVGSVFFAVVLVLVICVFVKTFSRMNRFENRFDGLSNHRRFK